MNENTFMEHLGVLTPLLNDSIHSLFDQMVLGFYTIQSRSEPNSSSRHSQSTSIDSLLTTTLLSK